LSQLLERSQWRYLLSHPWLLLLSIVGVAIGVGGMVGMDLAISSCKRAFRLSSQSLTGPATHWLVGPPQGLDENLYRRLRLEWGVELCAPVVEGYITLRGQSFRMLGVDPIAEAPFRGSWFESTSKQGENSQLTLAFAQPGAIALSQSEAERLRLGLESREGSLVVKALLHPARSNLEQALQGLVLCDIAVAQETLRMQGRLTRVELILSDSQVEPLAKRLPPEVSLLPAATRNRAIEQMSQAFFLNLRALSLLSLLVGVLLIYNVVHFLALQRMPWMAQLRLLGVSSQRLRQMLLAEAGWVGALGSALGLLLGISLARLLLPLLMRTINDLYYNLTVNSVYLSPMSLWGGAFLGWMCALAAAWWPVREASLVSPLWSLRRSELESQSLQWVGKLSWICSSVLGLSWLILLWAEDSLLLNLLAMFGVIAGSAGLTPAWVMWVQRWLRRILPLGLRGKLVLGGVERSLSRMGVALVAMTVALSAVISITIMVHSFRLSLLDWLGRTLSADLYVGQSNRQAAKAGQGLAPDLVALIAQQPEVKGLLKLKMQPVYFQSGSSSGTMMTQLVAQDPDWKRLRFLVGSPPSGPLSSGQLLASEPFLRKWRLQPGQTLRLQTPQGWRDFTLLAGFQDYASDSGYLMMDLGGYREVFRDHSLSGLGLLVAGDCEPLRRRILAWPQGKSLEIQSQRALRQLSLEIFEQTFQVTKLLQILAVLVAAAGIVGAVAAHQLERRRESALWACLGLSPRERQRLYWSEAALCGLWSGLAAWPCGLLQAYAMVVFINRRAFGWSLDFHVEVGSLLATPVLGLAAATLAMGLVRSSGRGLLEDLRSE
jgi:putative ABC transport system permease protein